MTLLPTLVAMNSLATFLLVIKNVTIPERLKFWKPKPFRPIRHKPIDAPAEPMHMGAFSYYVPRGRQEETPFLAEEEPGDMYMIKDGIQAGTKMPGRVFSHLYEPANVARVVAVDQRRLSVAPTHTRTVLRPRGPRFAPPVAR